ncbi:MAG: hypothetical protein ACI9KE_004521 [Polyangiales bacterium]|jgi:hypothetical protein
MAVEGKLSLEEEVKALRKGTTKGRRLLLLAFVGHVLILAALVGLPYLRGRLRAEHGKRALANYAACLLGGQPAAAPGLALPDDALEHYADEARLGRIQGCLSSLESLAPDDAFWLFPSTRHAESEVRRAVAMAAGELENVASAPAHHSPERPWLALQRVIAALSLWMQAADVQGNIFEPCVRFEADARSLRPERVPLQAASHAALQMRTHADGIAVLALDERGISWVRVAAGALDPRRLRRPALVRDVRFYAGEPWIVWATRHERCTPRCAQRTMGVARLDDSVVVTPEPVYLAAHPAGSIQTSVQNSEDYVWVAARRENGVGVVRFERPALDAVTSADGPASEEDVRSPLVGEVVAPARALRVAHLLRASTDGLWGIDFDGRLVDGAGRARAEDAEWLLPAGQSVFAGTNTGVVHVRGASSEHLETPPMTDAQVTFDGERAALGGIAEGTLHLIRCHSECETLTLPDVTLFRLAFLEDGLAVAHSMGGEIRVQIWNGDGLSPVAVPAPCWSESGGFCTPMVMTSRDGRVVLGGRDEQDLMVVETHDGVAWRRLVGLR